MRLLLPALLAGLLCNMQPAFAQALPDAVRAAGITSAQWQQAQFVIRTQASTLGLHENVIRTLAVEVFQAQPGQPIERCIALIQEGSARLPQVMAAAQALEPGNDPTLASLKAHAVEAAQAGRLREALTLQDQ